MRGNPPGADLGMPGPKAPLPELPAPVPFSISFLLICPFHILTDTPTLLPPAGCVMFYFQKQIEASAINLCPHKDALDEFGFLLVDDGRDILLIPELLL